jgi:SAM-dependent methyltransferase
VDTSAGVYYRPDLAKVHHLGFSNHAAACAPGIVGFLAPVRDRRGLVLELGCGTGLLTKELVAAGYRVIATDAAPAMLDIARDHVGAAALEVRQLTLPDDPLPSADAIVAIGHPLNYLPDADAIDRALVAMATALRPGGMAVRPGHHHVPGQPGRLLAPGPRAPRECAPRHREHSGLAAGPWRPR